MTSLDDHLRDASQAWMREASPTIAASAEGLARRLSPPRWWSYGMGTAGIVLVGAGLWWALASDPAPRSTPTSTPIKREVVEQRQVIPAAPPTSVPVEPARTQHTTDVDRRLRAQGGEDGFTVEYEKVLTRAMAVEATDPLSAASEYIGLARMCERRGRPAHAVSALERAEALTPRIGDPALTQRIRDMLRTDRAALAR